MKQILLLRLSSLRLCRTGLVVIWGWLFVTGLSTGMPGAEAAWVAGEVVAAFVAVHLLFGGLDLWMYPKG